MLASRRRRPDARLLIGLALVAAAVLGVVGLVAVIDRRTPVYAAAEALPPGASLDSGRLVERMVSLDGAEELYLRVGQLPEEGLVVIRPIGEGELLALASLGAESTAELTSIVITPAAPLGSAVQPGALVDVWTAAAPEEGRPAAPPSVLVAGAVVVQVAVETGFTASPRSGEVELLVPRARLARVLQALADEAALALVPAGLPLAAP